MKKIIVLFLISGVILFGFEACKKKSTVTTTTNNNNNNNETIEVVVPYTTTKTLTDSIPALPFAFPYPGLFPLSDTFATKTDEMLGVYAPGVQKDKIISLTPTYFKVSIDNAVAQNFDFVDDSINVFIDKFGGTSPVLVATKKGIQPGTTSITFDMVGPDIKELFYNDYLEISIKFGAKAGHEMKKNTTFITSLQFKVIAYKP